MRVKMGQQTKQASLLKIVCSYPKGAKNSIAKLRTKTCELDEKTYLNRVSQYKQEGKCVF